MCFQINLVTASSLLHGGSDFIFVLGKQMIHK